MTLRLAWEAVNNRWNQWVLNYSSAQQFNLLRDVGFDAPSWETLAQVFAFGVAGVTLLGIGAGYLQARHTPPWQRAMRRWRKALIPLGLDWGEHESPLRIAQRLRSHFKAPVDDALSAEVTALIGLLQQLSHSRYGQHSQAQPSQALTREFTARARRLQGLLASKPRGVSQLTPSQQKNSPTPGNSEPRG